MVGFDVVTAQMPSASKALSRDGMICGWCKPVLFISLPMLCSFWLIVAKGIVKCIYFVSLFCLCHSPRFSRLTQEGLSHLFPFVGWRPSKASVVVWRLESSKVDGGGFSLGLKSWEPGMFQSEDWCPSSAVRQRVNSSPSSCWSIYVLNGLDDIIHSGQGLLLYSAYQLNH